MERVTVSEWKKRFESFSSAPSSPHTSDRLRSESVESGPESSETGKTSTISDVKEIENSERN